MSPRNFEDQPSSTKLRINKDSLYIRKHPSPVPNNSNNNNNNLAPASKPHPHQPPVIIYTHSPKIIHSNPRDFMSLVQKLTGLSTLEDCKKSEPEKSRVKSKSTSCVMGEKVVMGEVKQESILMLDDYDQYLVDPPFFTPNSGDQISCPLSLRQNSVSIGESSFAYIHGVHESVF